MKKAPFVTSLRILIGILLLVPLVESANASTSICSWNLKDFGRSKKDSEIEYIAAVLVKFDVIAIQEVTASHGGAQAVARLVDCMNRKGRSWDYSISDPTSSGKGFSSERYAFIWDKKTISKVGDSWLDNNYAEEIDREPFLARFKKDGREFAVADFHAKPKAKLPETEIKYLRFLPALYANLNLIFCGDFNCPQSHSVFNPLKKMGYSTAFTGQKTTLRQKCLKNDCLASEFDNFFYFAKRLKVQQSGVIHFYKEFSSLEKARRISDHLPIFIRFD